MPRGRVPRGSHITRLDMEVAMRPTTALDDNVIDLNAVLHPGTVFEHPRDVVSHPTLSLSEKRAIHRGSRTLPPSRPAPRCGRPKV